MAKKIELSYETWMRETKRGIFTPRSGKLKVLDEAYEKFWLASTDTNRDKLVKALDGWIKEKGVDSAPNVEDGKWRHSTRNKTGTVEILFKQLHPLVLVPAPGEIRLAPSFRNASMLERTDSTRAFKDAIEMVEKAWLKIAISPKGEARTTYETWFGALTLANHAVVRKNLDKIHSALTARPIMLYYRGVSLPVGTPNDEAGRVAPIGPEDFFGAAYPVQPATLDQRFTHLFVGAAFFQSATLFQNDSMGGVMIHELSHAICQTTDVVWNGVTTYGEDLCKQLALNRPALAITNADNYEYFCESHQHLRYQTVRPPLNLPAKASISLDLR